MWSLSLLFCLFPGTIGSSFKDSLATFDSLLVQFSHLASATLEMVVEYEFDKNELYSLLSVDFTYQEYFTTDRLLDESNRLITVIDPIISVLRDHKSAKNQVKNNQIENILLNLMLWNDLKSSTVELIGVLTTMKEVPPGRPRPPPATTIAPGHDNDVQQNIQTKIAPSVQQGFDLTSPRDLDNGETMRN